MSELSNLFRWSKKITITDPEGNVVEDKKGNPVVVYMRVIGDDAFRAAREISLKRSRELRLKLRDEESNEYQALFLGMNRATKEELVMGIAFSEIPDYRDAGILELGELVFPELPDDPTLEQQEEHQADTERVKEDRVKKLTSFIESKGEERRKALLENDVEELSDLYKSSLINSRCMEEFGTSFKDYGIYRSVFTDSKFTKQAFDSFEDFESCSPFLKRRLTEAYTSLEMSGEQLKN